jgi:putative sugar O-methyltransferase
MKHLVKKLARSIIPPVLQNLIVKYKSRNAYPQFDLEYWSDSKENSDSKLAVMIDAFISSPDFHTTTKYWKYLLRKNLEQLSEFGLEKYGRNVARNYYTWTDFTDASISNLIHRDSAPQTVNLPILTVHNGFSVSESIKHNILIQLLLNHILANEAMASDLKKIESKGYIFGDHPHLDSEHGVLTLDKLSSVMEINSFAQILAKDEAPLILEIGAGSGRTANALLFLHSNAKYVIADIPPASFVAMTRLQLAFPNKRIFFAIDSYHVAKYLKSPEIWDVLFVLPSVLEAFPDKYFDLTLAIDCLHEMNSEMRTFFALTASKKSKHYFFKIWNSTTIPFDNLFLDSKNLEDYGVQPDWENSLSRECSFPSNFSEFLFKV